MNGPQCSQFCFRTTFITKFFLFKNTGSSRFFKLSSTQSKIDADIAKAIEASFRSLELEKRLNPQQQSQKERMPNYLPLSWNRPFISKTSKNHSSGLRNLGNTCYLNSSLQALAHTPAFLQILTKIPHSEQKCETIPFGKF